MVGMGRGGQGQRCFRIRSIRVFRSPTVTLAANLSRGNAAEPCSISPRERDEDSNPSVIDGANDEEPGVQQDLGAALAQCQLEPLGLIRAQVPWRIDPDMGIFILVPLEGDLDAGVGDVLVYHLCELAEFLLQHRL
jgi:hypothetical protein